MGTDKDMWRDAEDLEQLVRPLDSLRGHGLAYSVGTVLACGINQPDGLCPQTYRACQNRLIQSAQTVDRDKPLAVAISGFQMPLTGEGYGCAWLQQCLNLGQQFEVGWRLRLQCASGTHSRTQATANASVGIYL